MSEAHVKGEPVRQFFDWYTKRFGQERLVARLGALPPDLVGSIEMHGGKPTVISSHWYPARLVHTLVDEMLADYSPAQREMFARDAARATVAGSLHGVYRFLFETLMTPERYLSRAHKVFSRFYDTGTMRKIASEPNAHTTIIEGWTGHHPVLCDVLLYTGEFIYPSLGCRDVKVQRLACVSNGDPDCRYVVRWNR